MRMGQGLESGYGVEEDKQQLAMRPLAEVSTSQTCSLISKILYCHSLYRHHRGLGAMSLRTRLHGACAGRAFSSPIPPVVSESPPLSQNSQADTGSCRPPLSLSFFLVASQPSKKLCQRESGSQWWGGDPQDSRDPSPQGLGVGHHKGQVCVEERER